MKKGTVYILGTKQLKQKHELLQPLLFQAGCWWYYMGQEFKGISNNNYEVLYVNTNNELTYSSIDEIDLHGYEIINLSNLTFWNHPDDEQPESDCVFNSRRGNSWSDGLAVKAWIAMDDFPTLEEMNIGRKPKITKERRIELEDRLKKLEKEKAELEKELEE